MSNVDFTLMKKGYIPKIQRGRATLLSKAVLSGRKHSNKQIRLFHYDVEMRSSASPGPLLSLYPRKLPGTKLDRSKQACAVRLMILDFQI